MFDCVDKRGYAEGVDDFLYSIMHDAPIRCPDRGREATGEIAEMKQ